MLRFWREQAPFLGKTSSGFWEAGSVWGKIGSVLGENWTGFWIGLGQSSSLAVLNTKHVWVWIFEGFRVSLKISQPVELEG